MKFIISIIILMTVASCSIEHHLAKAKKQIDIAKRKGAVIKPDTVWQYVYTKEVVFDTLTSLVNNII